MGTILGKGFPQALVHTVHSTSAKTCACGKPFPKIVPMAKLDKPSNDFLYIVLHHHKNFDTQNKTSYMDHEKGTPGKAPA